MVGPSSSLNKIADYYSRKLSEFGATARGVDWNGDVSQTLRFEQLCTVFQKPVIDNQTVNDLGCGYGALFQYLQACRYPVRYNGFDLSVDMIAQAKSFHAGVGEARFAVGSAPDAVADYGIASGIFNVRVDIPDEPWLDQIHATLDAMHETSRLGFSFNALTAYSDMDKMRPYLYYADPCQMFDWCKRRYSRHVALLHDYGLYEFTIIVRKQI